MGDLSGSPDNFSCVNHQLVCRKPLPPSSSSPALRKREGLLLSLPWGLYSGPRGCLSWKSWAALDQVLLLNSSEEQCVTDKKYQTSFCLFLYSFLTPRKPSLLSQSSPWATAWKAVAFKTKLAQATGAGIDTWKLKQLLRSRLPSCLIQALKGDIATAIGEGAYKNPKLQNSFRAIPVMLHT